MFETNSFAKYIPCSHTTRRIALIGAFDTRLETRLGLAAFISAYERAFGTQGIIRILSEQLSVPTSLPKSCLISNAVQRTAKKFSADELGDILLEASGLVEACNALSGDENTVSELKEIFSGLDLLHVEGTGYECDDDKAKSMFLAAALTKLAGGKVVVTGANWEDASLDTLSYLRGLTEFAQTCDFIDSSWIVLEKSGMLSFTGKAKKTVADAACFHLPAHIRCSVASSRNSSIVDVYMGSNLKASAKTALGRLVPLISDGGVSAVNVFCEEEPTHELIDEMEKHCPDAQFTFIDASKMSLDDISGLAASAEKAFSDNTAFSWLCALVGTPVDCLDTTNESIEEACAASQNGMCRANLSAARYEKLCRVAAALSEDPDEQAEIVSRMESGTSRGALVSIIVPAYNMAAHIDECLASIVSQTLRDIEIIVVDDGSTDRTQEKLYSWAWKDRRIRVITQSNSGVSAARNRAMREACGKYLFFLDSDDWIVGNKALERLYGAAEKYGVQVAGGNFIADFGDCIVGKEFDGNLARYTFQTEEVMPYSEFQFDFGWIRFLYDRKLIIDNGFFFDDMKFYEDPVWFVNVMDTAGIFAAVPHPVYCYRTDYHPVGLDVVKTRDLLLGLKHNMAFAKERGYEELYQVTFARMVKDFSTDILYHASADCDDEIHMEIRDLLNEINSEIYGEGSSRRVEAFMGLYAFWNSDGRRIHELAEKEQELTCKKEEALLCRLELDEARRQLDGIRSSTTWKVGDAALAVPKKAKSFLRGRLVK